MTNTEAVAEALQNVRECLENAGFLDGNTLTETQCTQAQSVIFWNTVCNSVAGASKPIYIVVDTLSTKASGYADDAVYSREVGVSVDIWSTYPFTNVNLQNVENAVENALTDEWEISREQSYNSETQTYGVHFALYKNFK